MMKTGKWMMAGFMVVAGVQVDGASHSVSVVLGE